MLAAQKLGAALSRKGLQPPLPSAAHTLAARSGRAPLRKDILRDHKRRVAPAEPLACPDNLGRTERRAVGCGGSGLGRRAKRDRRPARDQARALILLGPPDRVGDRLVIVAVDSFGSPPMSPETLHLVVRDGEAGRAVDRDSVVVPEHD